jgi:hypothetical protein
MSHPDAGKAGALRSPHQRAVPSVTIVAPQKRHHAYGCRQKAASLQPAAKHSEVHSSVNPSQRGESAGCPHGGFTTEEDTSLGGRGEKASGPATSGAAAPRKVAWTDQEDDNGSASSTQAPGGKRPRRGEGGDSKQNRCGLCGSLCSSMAQKRCSCSILCSPPPHLFHSNVKMLMRNAGPEGYMAENIPIYAYYTGIIYTGTLGEKGYMGIFRGARFNFQGLRGGHTCPNAMQTVSFDRQLHCACTGEDFMHIR